MSETTYWNGEPCPARVVRVSLPDGTEVEAVEVIYDGDPMYLDNEAFVLRGPHIVRDERGIPKVDSRGTLQFDGEDVFEHTAGSAWRKVTTGRGSPQWGHRNLFGAVPTTPDEVH